MSLVIEEQEIDSLPITIDPDVVSGAPVFRGTRVPVDALLSNRSGVKLGRISRKLSHCFPRASTPGAGFLPLNLAEVGLVQMKILLDECAPRLLKRLLSPNSKSQLFKIWAGRTSQWSIGCYGGR
jgi:hypothetical protein